jgi:hypothetical protein
VQDERELDLPMDLREPAQVEILRPINLDMDVADAHGQEVDPGGRDEPCCQAWVGPAPAPAAVPRDAGGQLADFGLDGKRGRDELARRRV